MRKRKRARAGTDSSQAFQSYLTYPPDDNFSPSLNHVTLRAREGSLSTTQLNDADVEMRAVVGVGPIWRRRRRRKKIMSMRTRIAAVQQDC